MNSLFVNPFKKGEGAVKTCPTCGGFGEVPTVAGEFVPCPTCTIPDPVLPEDTGLEPVKVFVENGVQVKDQDDKVPLHLVTKDMADAILECGKVMQFGRIKYPIRKGWLAVPADDVDGGIERHSNAYFRGEKTDPQSGLSHLAHLAINALMNLQKEIEGKNG